MSEVVKVGYYVPVSFEMLVDNLPLTTIWMGDGDKAVEYLRLGQAVRLGEVNVFDPAYVAEGLEASFWDDGWPWALPYPEEDEW